MATEVHTLADVQRHNTPDDIWVVIHNKVYNVTNYLEDHPGGSAILLEVAGKDATAEFEETGHSAEANDALLELCVGHLPEEERAEAVQVYRPTFEVVSQTAAIVTKKSAGPGPLRRLVGAVFKIGVTSGVGAGIWAVSTGRIDTQALRHIYQQVSLPRSVATNGRFWWGFGLATVAEMSASLGLLVWLWSKLDVQGEFTQHVSHRTARKDRSMALPRARPQVPGNLKAAASVSRVLEPKNWKSFKLVRKTLVSPNVYRLVFALPHFEDVLGLPTGQHIALRAVIDGQNVSRSYTPISNNSDLGRIELLIKVYDKGLMTKHLEGMKIGETIDIRGPKGAMQYSNKYAKHIGMIAGGTGITPMYQLIRAICADESDNTKISLLYANNTENDILLREELDGFALQCPEKFQVQYVLGKASEDWKGPTGFVTADLIKKYLPPASDDSKVLLCGPPPMINAMKKNLASLGFKEPGALSKVTDQIFLF
ncbi:hypothetical protein jhhlp_007502 [Lomentospora prolificans]|uniref:NADH-cytochrome b5 reductase 1 n=1 Tax=Lomentospora prolificans TaxID=41688 RepID=A0A2N3N183_9PEZI|nr:hypothetical protein jhhlp_007502 [Lomentospora prolificans]